MNSRYAKDAAETVTARLAELLLLLPLLPPLLLPLPLREL